MANTHLLSAMCVRKLELSYGEMVYICTCALHLRVYFPIFFYFAFRFSILLKLKIWLLSSAIGFDIVFFMSLFSLEKIKSKTRRRKRETVQINEIQERRKQKITATTTKSNIGQVPNESLHFKWVRWTNGGQVFIAQHFFFLSKIISSRNWLKPKICHNSFLVENPEMPRINSRFEIKKKICFKAITLWFW